MNTIAAELVGLWSIPRQGWHTQYYVRAGDQAAEAVVATGTGKTMISWSLMHPIDLALKQQFEAGELPSEASSEPRYDRTIVCHIGVQSGYRNVGQP